MDQTLQAKVLALREAGGTTPDICRDLNLEADVVIALLVTALTGNNVPTVPNRPPGRPRLTLSEAYLNELLEVLSPKGRKSPIWTIPRFMQSLQALHGAIFSTDTLRRYTQELGLTFSKELGDKSLSVEVKKLIIAKQPLIYILTHRTAKSLQIEGCNAVVLVGITSSNRLAFSVSPQSRISPHILSDFLWGLLKLHPQRHILVLLSRKRYGALLRHGSQPPTRRLHFCWI